MRRDPITRFRAKVRVDAESGCHLWTAERNAQGYGRFWLDGKTQRAHRVAYEFSRGEIPPGLFVCHACDNTACVNPKHLFLGTHEDNMADMVSKGRQSRPSGVKNGCAKLVDGQIRRIRALYATGLWSQRKLAVEFGVSPTMIFMIVNRRKWAHVEPPKEPPA